MCTMQLKTKGKKKFKPKRNLYSHEYGGKKKNLKKCTNGGKKKTKLIALTEKKKNEIAQFNK